MAFSRGGSFGISFSGSLGGDSDPGGVIHSGALHSGALHSGPLHSGDLHSTANREVDLGVATRSGAGRGSLDGDDVFGLGEGLGEEEGKEDGFGSEDETSSLQEWSVGGGGSLGGGSLGGGSGTNSPRCAFFTAAPGAAALPRAPSALNPLSYSQRNAQADSQSNLSCAGSTDSQPPSQLFSQRTSQQQIPRDDSSSLAVSAADSIPEGGTAASSSRLEASNDFSTAAPAASLPPGGIIRINNINTYISIHILAYSNVRICNIQIYKTGDEQPPFYRGSSRLAGARR